MPPKRARNPAEAEHRFKRPLQVSLSCISPAVWRPSKTDNRFSRLLWLGATPTPLSRVDGGPIYLTAAMLYSFYKKEGEFRIHTDRYIYQVFREADMTNRWLEWHWHPPEVQRPHIHVGGEWDGFHLPSGRVTFEIVAEFLVVELGVTPKRSDWQKKLHDAHEQHLSFRSWS